MNDRDEKARAGREAKRASDTVKAVMSTYEGRWWMADLLERSNMFSDIYRFDGDPLGMAWRDGQANMGRYLLGQIDEYASGEYQRLIRERRTRLERTAEALQKARDSEQPFQEARATIDDRADDQLAAYEAEKSRRAQQEPTSE